MHWREGARNWIVVGAVLCILAGTASAMDPPTLSALGVYETMPSVGSNPGLSDCQPAGWAGPLNGYYYIKAPAAADAWAVLSQAPSGAVDGRTGAAAYQLATDVPPLYQYLMVKPTKAGWIRVIAYKNGGQLDQAYYRCYEAAIVEGDRAIREGAFDVRYGHVVQDHAISGLGGPWHNGLQIAKTAEDMLGYDDRTQIQGGSVRWTGNDLPSNAERIPIWLPEALLEVNTGTNENSLMATKRNLQNLQVLISGPEEGLPVPLAIVITPRVMGASGEIQPGWTPSPTRTILNGIFNTPIVPPGSGPPWPGGGSFIWMGQNIQGTHLRVANGTLWCLPMPWQGREWSSSYGDLEIELCIPSPNAVAFNIPKVTFPEEEGIIYGKLGTVARLVQLDDAPVTGLSYPSLLEYWFHQVSFGVAPGEIDPDMITLGCGIEVLQNRVPDPPREILFLPTAWADREDRYAADYMDEAMFNVVNQKLDEHQGVYTGALKAELPEDISNSLLVQVRGYLGSINYKHVQQDACFDAEPTEMIFEDTVKNFVVNFINLRTDSNNDGSLTPEDEDNEDPTNPAHPAMVVRKLSEFRIILSDPIGSDDYDDKVVTLELAQACSDPNWDELCLYADQNRAVQFFEENDLVTLVLEQDAQGIRWKYNDVVIANGTTCSLWVEPGPVPQEVSTRLLAYLGNDNGSLLAADRVKMTIAKLGDLNLSEHSNSTGNKVVDSTDEHETSTEQTLYVAQDQDGDAEIRLEQDWYPPWLLLANFDVDIVWKLVKKGGGTPLNWTTATKGKVTGFSYELLKWTDPGTTANREFEVYGGFDFNQNGELDLGTGHSEALRKLQVVIVKLKDFKLYEYASSSNSKTDTTDSDSTPTDQEVFMVQSSAGEAKIGLSMTWEPSSAPATQFGSRVLWRVMTRDSTPAPAQNWSDSTGDEDDAVGSFSSTPASAIWTEPSSPPDRPFYVFAGYDFDGDGVLSVEGTYRESSRRLELAILKGQKIALGGTEKLSKYVVGKLYNPTRFGGKIEVSGASVDLYYYDGDDLDTDTIFDLYEDALDPYETGNPCTARITFDDGDDYVGWYYVYVDDEEYKDIQVSFTQSGGVPAEDRPWNFYYWPAQEDLPGDRPALYSAGGALEKYDGISPATTAQTWERTHHGSSTSWHGHCLGLSLASMFLNQPTPTAASGLTQDELEGLWGELGEDKDNADSEGWGYECAAGPPIPGTSSDDTDRCVGTLHSMLVTYIRGDGVSLQSNLRTSNPSGSSTSKWNHAVHKYEATFTEASADDVNVVQVVVKVHANFDHGTLTPSTPSNGTNDRINIYTYIIKYNSSHAVEQDWVDRDFVSVAGDAQFAPSNMLLVTGMTWNAKNPEVTEAKVRSLDANNPSED